ncbi:MAG: GGDEF domain-containing protein [Aquificaceae bacterium]|nr:GGDEF domain-containing protein [Aquificaceae bacterium]
MSIRKRIYLSLLFSVSLTLIISFILLYFISSRLIEGRIRETYEFIYKNYKEIVNHEKEDLRFLDENSAVRGDYYYKEKLRDNSCDEEPYYRILPSGPYYGMNRLYPDGCYFVGIKLEDILKLMKNSVDVDWIIYYNRNLLKDVLDGSIDSFMKEKVVIDNVVIDRFSNPKVLYMPLDVKGYMLHGSFLKKSLLVEVPLTGMNGLPIGRVVLIKDVSGIYKETYLIFLALALYSLFVFSFLAFMLFRIASSLASRVIFLKNITASIEKRDFSVIDLLKNSKESSKDEVWELKHSIYNMAVSLKNAFEELKEKQKELEELAFYDPLTGLPNRRFFFDHASLILESVKRYRTPLTLLLMDLDHFKNVNDTYGHEAGDVVLKNFADVLRKSSRKSDLPARLGGEEFALLMPNTDLQQGRVVAERIRQEFQNSIIVYEGREIKMTLSGGLASYGPDVEGIDDLIRMADEALYKAKELGRNRIEVYEPKI